MNQFVRNEGQYHPMVAFVAQLGGDLLTGYHGCGGVTAVVDAALRVLSWEYTGEDTEDIALARQIEAGRYEIGAGASSTELVVGHGSAAAALLNALLDLR